MAGLAALAITAAPAQAAESFTMEGVFGIFPSLTLVSGPLTLTITPEGRPGASIYAVPSGVPLIGNGVEARGSSVGPWGPIRFAFDQDVGPITFDFGDAGGDDDGEVVITAFNSAGLQLGSASDTYPAFFAAGKSGGDGSWAYR
jgi:hypothetical protein